MDEETSFRPFGVLLTDSIKTLFRNSGPLSAVLLWLAVPLLSVAAAFEATILPNQTASTILFVLKCFLISAVIRLTVDSEHGVPRSGAYYVVNSFSQLPMSYRCS